LTTGLREFTNDPVEVPSLSSGLIDLHRDIFAQDIIELEVLFGAQQIEFAVEQTRQLLAELHGAEQQIFPEGRLYADRLAAHEIGRAS
jgi:hypothetical protein